MTRKKVLLYFLAVMGVAFALRLPSLLVSFSNIDENEYALAAHIINQGGIPYKDFLIYQPPGIYYLYAFTFRFFPEALMETQMWWVHLVIIVIVILTCWSIYRVAKNVYDDRVTAFFASLFYAIFSATFLPQDMLGANIELLMVLPMTLSVLFFLKGEKHSLYYFISGIFLGLSILTKYQGGILFLAFLLTLFFLRPFQRGFFPFLLILLGSLLVGSAWVYYLDRHGALEAAQQCFFYILDYAKGPPGTDWIYLLLKFLMRTAIMFLSGFVLWYFATRMIWHHFRHWWVTPPQRLLLVFWLLTSIVPVIVGGRIYFHYYLLLFPPLCLLGAEWWHRFFNRLRQMPFEKVAWRLTLFFIAILIPVTGFTAYATYKPFRPKHKDDWIYVVDYIQERTQVRDPIFVWGYCPQIYTISNRPPATRFTTADYITGRTPKTAGLEYDPDTPNPPSVWTKLIRDFTTPKEVIDYDTSKSAFPGAMELLMADFQKNPPVLIIDTAPSNYRLYGRYPLKEFPTLHQYIQKNYRLEATIRNTNIYRRKPTG